MTGTGTRTGVPAPGARWQRGQWGSVSPNPGHGAGGWHPGVARGGFKGQTGRCPLCQASPSPRSLRALRPRLPPQGTGRHSCRSLRTAAPPPSWGWRGTGWSPGWGGGGRGTRGGPRGWVLGGLCATPPSRVSPNPVTGLGDTLAASGHRSAPCLSFPLCPALPGTCWQRGHPEGWGHPGPRVCTPRAPRYPRDGEVPPAVLSWHGITGLSRRCRGWHRGDNLRPPRGQSGATRAANEGTSWGHRHWHRGVSLETLGPALRGRREATGAGTELCPREGARLWWVPAGRVPPPGAALGAPGAGLGVAGEGWQVPSRSPGSRADSACPSLAAPVSPRW